MTTTPDEVTVAADRRADLIAGFTELNAWLKAKAAAARQFGTAVVGIPERPVIQLPVPAGLDHGQKLAWLEQVAAEWETETFPDGMGGFRAEKEFRVLRLAASVACPDRSVSGYKARAAQAGNGASA